MRKSKNLARYARRPCFSDTDEKRIRIEKTGLCNYPATIVSTARMLSTDSQKDAQLLASSDSDIFSLVAANGRAKNKNGINLGFIQDRRLRANGFIVRAQSVIRAAGPPAAPDLPE